MLQMKPCVPMAQLLNTRALVVELCVRYLVVVCFLDDTNNSKLETTIYFVKNVFLHGGVWGESNKCLLPSKSNSLTTALFVSLLCQYKS